MKNKKRNTIITFVVVGIILLIGGIVFILNHSVTSNGLSVLEKKWINDHANQVIDIYTYNDVPVYGYNGSGVNFDFLNFFTSRYKVAFNKISYYTSSKVDDIDFGFRVIPSSKVTDHDIVFDTDYYGIVSLKDEIVSLDSLLKVGVLENDSEVLKEYFGEDRVVTYKSSKELLEGISKDEVSYACISILQNMDYILENKLHIVYHVDDVSKLFVLRINDETVYNIMSKIYSEYLEQGYQDSYSKNYLSVYFDSTHTSDAVRKSYNSKIYKYGYVVNMPFENYATDEFVGTLSNYLKEFQDISFSEVDVVPYDSVDDLKSALVSEEVDFALGNFDYDTLNLNYVVSSSFRDLDYVVLSKEDYVVNSILGFKDEKLSVVGGSLLGSLCKENGIKIHSFSNTDDLIRGIDDQSIILMDRETYQYYKDSKLMDYHVVLSDSIIDGYRFIMNGSNEAFNSLFNYYISSTSYHKFMYQYRTDIDMSHDDKVIEIFIFIVVLILFLIGTIIFISRKTVVQTVSKKDEKLKYIDQLTSLKNRSYLNKNIYSWDDNVIFPQAIIVFDLVHIKRINDKFGRESGDEIIKQSAGILINQQLENTDIIRSDGDEFIIYMVGYDEDKVKEYMNKLLKLMRGVPKSLGVDAGYSMIFDEVKTVDDAINEAILMIMKSRDRD